MQIPDTPLFVKTHDFNVWLLNHTRRFPKHFRQTLTQRMELIALEFEERILWEQHVRRLHFHQVERPHVDRILFTSRVSFL